MATGNYGKSTTNLIFIEINDFRIQKVIGFKQLPMNQIFGIIRKK